MSYGYSFAAYNKDHMVRVVGRDIPISTKHSIEICGVIRNKPLAAAKKIVAAALEEKNPIPFRRFTNGLGHKPGMAAGQFPKKACSRFQSLLNALETNAQQKGLNTAHLVVIHAVANRGPRPYRAGRHRGRRMKNTHIELVAREKKQEAKETGKEMKQKQEPKPEKQKRGTNA